jgi:hypothetical protein
MARNTDVSPYIGKLSRSQVYSKKGQYKRERKGVMTTVPGVMVARSLVGLLTLREILGRETESSAG